MVTLEHLPVNALSLELLQAGSFDSPKRGWVHTKTVPYTILAQAFQGRYEIFTDDGRHEDLLKGEAFLTHANMPMRIIHHGDRKRGYRMRARWIHMHFTLFGSIDVTNLLQLPLGVSERACGPFVEIIEALLDLDRQEDRSFGWAARRGALAHQALAELCRLAPMRPDASALMEHTERLAPVLSYMEDHLEEKLSVEALADQVHVSAPHLHAVFRKAMGRSPMKHLRYLRLARACRLLATGDATLQTIAERTGFCNEFHLSREFRRAFGKPPGAWRREYDRSLV